MTPRPRLPFDPQPETLALAAKDLLRTARYGLRRARALMPPLALDSALPGDSLARRVADGADWIAEGALDQASALARAMLTPPVPPGEPRVLPQPLDALRHAARDGAALADAGYEALRLVLDRLGARDALISEMALRAAFDAVLERDPDPDPGRFATALDDALRAHRVIPEVVTTGEGPAPEDIARLARFAFCLALAACTRTGCGEAEAAAILLAAADLSLSLAPEIRAAGTDAAALATLFARYAPHV